MVIDKEKLATEIGEYWLNNCTDGDYFKNCMISICDELNHDEGPLPDEAYEIWNLIEEKYCDQCNI